MGCCCCYKKGKIIAKGKQISYNKIYNNYKSEVTYYTQSGSWSY